MRIEEISHDSELLTEDLKAQLPNILQRVTKPLEIKIVTKDKIEKSTELASFLLGIADLCDHLSVSMAEDFDADTKCMETPYLPTFGLFTEGKYSGVAFSGIPGGNEVNSLILALINVGGEGQAIDAANEKEIMAIQNDIHVDIAVSLACHFCQEVVTYCQKIASMNDHVSARMIDARLYPELVEKYHIERVPVMIVNENQTYLGKKTMEDVITILKNTEK